MTYQSQKTLLKSSLVMGTPRNHLEQDLLSLFTNMRNKGFDDTDKSALYAEAASCIYADSFLATGTFSENKGILE